jgi:hypothetical protein
MGRNKRLEKRALRLDEAKEEFEKLLRELLPECARGRWGLFDQRESVHTSAHKLPHDRHVKVMNRINAALNLLEQTEDESEDDTPQAKGLPEGDMAPRNRFEGWVEADQLRELALEVVSLRDELGETGPWLPLDAYLKACAIKGTNAPGEPRIAMQVISELKAWN